MTPGPIEAINTLYHDDLYAHNIDNLKFCTCDKRGRDARRPPRKTEAIPYTLHITRPGFSSVIPFHWQCLLKTKCYNANEREAIDTNDTRACPAYVDLNENEKRKTIKPLKRESMKVSWNSTWEPEELQNYTVKALDAVSNSTKSISRHQT